MTEKRRIRREGGRERKEGCRKLCRWKEEDALGKKKGTEEDEEQCSEGYK